MSGRPPPVAATDGGARQEWARRRGIHGHTQQSGLPLLSHFDFSCYFLPLLVMPTMIQSQAQERSSCSRKDAIATTCPSPYLRVWETSARLNIRRAALP